MNSVCLSFSSSVDAPDELFAIARGLSALGCELLAHSHQSLVLYRFDAAVTPLLTSIHGRLHQSRIGASVVVAVRVREGKRRRPSEKTVEFGRALATEATPGALLLSVRLATLLEATETACRRYLHPSATTTACGATRTVVRFALSAATERSITGSAIAGRLSPERVQLLSTRLALRLNGILPTELGSALAHRVRQGDLPDQLRIWLCSRVPTSQHHFIHRVVEEEFRTIYVRSARYHR